MKYRINKQSRYIYVCTENLTFSDSLDQTNFDQVVTAIRSYEDGILNEETFELEVAGYLFEDVKEVVENKKMVNTITGGEHYEFRDDRLYLKGIPLSIPREIAKGIEKAALSGEQKELNRWINFWKWLAMHPLPESREHLYDTLVSNGIQILECGLLLMYRRVLKVNDVDTRLLEWASKTYAEFRRRKKSTNVKVFRYYDENMNPVYSLDTGEYIGLLPDLRNSTEEQYYTDNHTQTMRYYIGREMRMPMEDVNKNRRNECSTGFHLGAKGFSYSGFGDTPLACIVNPMDVIAVMKNDHGKTRCAAFTPIAVLNKDAEWADEVDIDSLVDIVYAEQVARLNKLLETANIQDENNTISINLEVNLALKDIDAIQLFSR